MRANRLGCLTGTGLLAAVITALVIAGYVYASGGLIYNPGPLNAQQGRTLGGVASHAQISGNCDACHTAPWDSAVMADRCAVCHTDIAVQMKDVASMHGTLMHNNPKLGCRHCHPEHRGAAAKLTELGSADFPHEVVGYSLKGHQRTAANAPFTCDDCHPGDITRFAIDTCQACHRQMDAGFTQAHLLAFGSACLNCHDGVDRYGDDFDHSRFAFPLAGKHTGLACSQCHLDAGTVADLQSLPQDCDSCHHQDEPHQGRFGTDCAACHTAAGWMPAKFDHNLSTFKLVGSHASVKCEQCHINNVFKGTPLDCYSCHKKDDRHNGQFGTDCSLCHQPTEWADATFDHSKSKFPLTGAHANVPCTQCHADQVFQGLDTACTSCHGDPSWHAGAFGLDCAACHTTDGWNNAKFGGRHPSFGDEGGINHGGASCQTCHTVNVYNATCTACHKNNNPGSGD
jgi:hypothetical protein